MRLVRQKKLAHQSPPIELDAEKSSKKQAEDDFKNLLVDPMGRQNVDIYETVDKTDWAKNITKAVTHVMMMMKEKRIDARLDYTNLILERDDDPLPHKFKLPDMKKFTWTEDLHLHLK